MAINKYLQLQQLYWALVDLLNNFLFLGPIFVDMEDKGCRQCPPKMVAASDEEPFVFVRPKHNDWHP